MRLNSYQCASLRLPTIGMSGRLHRPTKRTPQIPCDYAFGITCDRVSVSMLYGPCPNQKIVIGRVKITAEECKIKAIYVSSHFIGISLKARDNVAHCQEKEQEDQCIVRSAQP